MTGYGFGVFAMIAALMAFGIGLIIFLIRFNYQENLAK